MDRKEQLCSLSRTELIDLIIKKENEIKNLKDLGGNKISKGTWPYGKSYNTQWTWASKVVFAVYHAGRPLLSYEILDFLEKNEPRVEYWNDKLKALSVHIHAAQKNNRLRAYKIVGMQGRYYGLPQWFDEQGELLSLYSIHPDFQ